MPMQNSAPVTIKRPSGTGRSRVTNGHALHVGGDPRGKAARRYRDLLHGYRAKLGHPPDPIEDSQLRIAAAIALRSEQLARRLASGKPVAAGDLTGLASELRRVLGRLGIGGNGQAVDEGPTIEAFLAEHAAKNGG